MNSPELQKAFEEFCAEIVAADERKSRRVEHIKQCFCFACKELITQLNEPEKPKLDSFGV